MTYQEVIEAHRKNTVRYVGDSFGVNAERVTFIGVTKVFPVRTICNHKSTATLEPISGPEIFVSRPPVIELTRDYEHVDKVLNRQTRVMAGQCPDCGQVYFTER